MSRICSECGRPEFAGKLCQAHYVKLRRTGVRGGPLRRLDMTRLDRYLSYVNRGAPDECWPWTASLTEHGYGQFDNGLDAGARGTGNAHRYGFAQLVHPLQPGETVDHICHNRSPDCRGGNDCPHRACQNPAHWEAVSGLENWSRGRSFIAANGRKTHCKWGHELTPENSYGYNGHRQCKKCARLTSRGEHPRQLAKFGLHPPTSLF